jgi:uncharacterized protein YbjT (DUF2867 family)
MENHTHGAELDEAGRLRAAGNAPKSLGVAALLGGVSERSSRLAPQAVQAAGSKRFQFFLLCHMALDLGTIHHQACIGFHQQFFCGSVAGAFRVEGG